jgi:hypothetical protein
MMLYRFLTKRNSSTEGEQKNIAIREAAEKNAAKLVNISHSSVFSCWEWPGVAIVSSLKGHKWNNSSDIKV